MIKRLTILLLSITYFIFYCLIRKFSSIIGHNIPGSNIIITYHSVKPEHFSKFSQHMMLLKKIGKPSIISELSNDYLGSKPRIFVTFDDGYQNTFTNALPIMIKYSIPSVIFVTTGYLGQKPGWIKDQNHENYNERIIQGYDISKFHNDIVLTGSHTVNHHHLDELGELELKSEMMHSKAFLENLTSHKITFLSFPYGSYNEKVLKHAKSIGYRKVFTNIPIPKSGSFNTFLYGRINISFKESLIESYLKMHGAYNWIAYAIILKRMLYKLLKSHSAK